MRILKKLLSIRFFNSPRIFNVVKSRFFVNLRIKESDKMNIDECFEKSKNLLADIFGAGVRAVQPDSIIENCVSIVNDEMRIGEKRFKVEENIYVVGFGKAVMGMAATMEKKLGHRLKRGIVSIPRSSRDIYYRGDKKTSELNFPNFNGLIDYRESSRDNQPDEDTLMTSHDIVDLAESLGEKDTLIVLISGGGSALFFMPRPTISSESKIRLCKKLQNSGASIKELNVVRRKMSMVKGGGLALMAYPAKIITLVLSDIVGDPIDLVASGPTVYSQKLPEQISSILQKYNLQNEIDGDLKNILTLRESKIDEKTLLNAKKEFKHVDNIIVGNNELATKAAANEARRKGLNSVILRNDVVGNVRDVGHSYAKLCNLVCRAWNKDIERKDFYEATKDDKFLSLTGSMVDEIFNSLETSSDSGIVLIGGGEPEVVVTGDGRGGRNQELALSFSIDFLSEIKNYPQLINNYEVIFLSAGTDGQDGPTDAAGAFGYPAIEPIINVLIKKLRKISNQRVIDEKYSKNHENHENFDVSSKLRIAEKIVPCNALMNNDSYNFYSRFRRGKDLLKTGITGTNVMDLHFLLVRKRVCGCNLDFERIGICPDLVEEHDLSENIDDETIKSDKRFEKRINEVETKLLNLRVLDSSLTKHCCQKKSD